MSRVTSALIGASLLTSLACVACSSAKDASVESRKSTTAQLFERKLTPITEGEYPGFTIAREYEKYKAVYPFIRPIEPDLSDAIIANEGVTYRQIGDRQLKLDLYQPANSQEMHPAVLLIHGGGWRTGDRSHQVPMAQALATAGYIAAAVEYRLSTEALYPAAIDDLRTAVDWLRHNSQKYAIDINRIAVLGASSGAHLATLLGSTSHLSTFAGLDEKSSSIQAIINIDGVVELLTPLVRSFEDNPTKASSMGLWLGGRYDELPELWKEVSPLEYAGADTPPTLFINSALPRFHSGRDDFMQILNEHNIYTEIHTIANTPHPFWLFHPWFDETRDIILRFLNRVFYSQDISTGNSDLMTY